MIARSAGDSFGAQRAGELVAREAVEVVGVVAERIKVPNRTAVFRQTGWLDAANFFEAGCEIIGVLLATSGFAQQLLELLEKNHRLELLHAIVTAAREEL